MKNKRDKYYLIAAAILIVCSLCVWQFGLRHRKPDANELLNTGITTEKFDAGKMLNKKIFQTETNISCEVIEDGLTKMGTLVTAKYYFKDIVSIEKVPTLKGLKFLTANADVIFEGYVPAGINFEKIMVSVDNDRKEVNVRVPKAELMETVIDFNNIEIKGEKDNIVNRLKMEDAYQAAEELTNNAKSDAIKLGLLDDADANAESLIFNFVSSFTNETGYKTVIVH